LLRQALLEAGAIRFKPIFLTAAAAMTGAAFIISGPIFQDLAVSLVFGLASSTALTVLVIPAAYVWLRGDHQRRAPADAGYDAWVMPQSIRWLDSQRRSRRALAGSILRDWQEHWAAEKVAADTLMTSTTRRTFCHGAKSCRGAKSRAVCRKDGSPQAQRCHILAVCFLHISDAYVPHSHVEPLD
jgi:hypothetical protein